MPEQKPHLGCGKKSVFVDILGGICTEIDFLFEQRRRIFVTLSIMFLTLDRLIYTS